jgi:hypothetical protein
MSFKFAGVAALGLAAALPVSAVTITFDDLAPGSTLGNPYAALGVTFSPNAFSGAGSSTSGQPWATNTDMTIVSAGGVADVDVGILGAPSLVSGNVLRRYTNWFGENGDPSFLITFTTPVTSVSLDFASLGSDPGDTRLFIYNGTTLLTTLAAPVPATPGVSQARLSFAAASITSVAVAPGSYLDWVAVDNLVFAPVPETSTYALMALGLALVGVAAHRRTG